MNILIKNQKVLYDAVDYKKARYNILSEQTVRKVRIPVKMNTASGLLCWGTSKVRIIADCLDQSRGRTPTVYL